MNIGTSLVAKVVFSARYQKQGEHINDCQDFFAINIKNSRYAISDGVSRSFFPGEWAEKLVNYFCFNPSENNICLFENQNWLVWLKPIQDDWYATISKIVAAKPGLEYVHLRNSLAQKESAAATFIGLELMLTPDNPKWRSIIIGDSCLFRIREHQIDRFIIKVSSDFNNHPKYFPSNNLEKPYEPTFIEGDILQGDVFILATDLLSKWILSHIEKGTPIQEIIPLESDCLDETLFINHLKENGIKSTEDDDITILIIKIQTNKSENTVISNTRDAYPDSKPNITTRSTLNPTNNPLHTRNSSNSTEIAGFFNETTYGHTNPKPAKSINNSPVHDTKYVDKIDRFIQIITITILVLLFFNEIGLHFRFPTNISLLFIAISMNSINILRKRR